MASTNKGVNLCSKDIAQTQQKLELPTVTLTWPVSEYKIPTRYIPPEMYSLRKGCPFPVAYDVIGQGQHKSQACDLFFFFFSFSLSAGFSGQVGSIPRDPASNAGWQLADSSQDRGTALFSSLHSQGAVKNKE